jgi:hypothetical protein
MFHHTYIVCLVAFMLCPKNEKLIWPSFEFRYYRSDSPGFASSSFTVQDVAETDQGLCECIMPAYVSMDWKNNEKSQINIQDSNPTYASF